MDLIEIKKKYPQIPLGRAKDLAGKRFGRLVALYRTKRPEGKSKGTYWVCQCDCGTIRSFDAGSLTAGRSTSCGCNTTIINVARHEKERIGQKFGHWTIVEKDRSNLKKWICECDCSHHTKKSMRIDEMRRSLGCEYCSTASNKFIDLTGKHFGHWTVLYRAASQGCHTMWHCRCDCAAHTERDIDAYKLKTGKSLSCGCDGRSRGEQMVEFLLSQNDIPFEQEKSFKSCQMTTHGKMRFDFFVNNKYIIEYDGEQHFIERKSGWNAPEKIKATQARDSFKNQWCKDNSIPLIRIPYTHLKDLCIDDLKLETTKFRVC